LVEIFSGPLENIGTTCYSPCVIPVWFGIEAPSGVLAIGLGFTLRDLVQRTLDLKWTVVAILIGATLSAWLNPFLALASGSAFLFSEMMDLGVYTPLQKHNLFLAVIGSNAVGLIADSVIFLFLAFGSLDFLTGQIIGKLWMTVLALPVIYLIRVYKVVIV
jgi:uncharacterized PurR-regulated membrane protein YhhQ (DUF165 family)